jgi:hypothetical protein
MAGTQTQTKEPDPRLRRGERSLVSLVRDRDHQPGGATAADWLWRAIAAATKPDAFISSMNAAR